MRKLSTMLALGLALVMTFGMTVSAAGSPVPGSNDVTEALGKGVTSATTNVEGVTVNADCAITEASYNEADAIVVELNKDSEIENAVIVAAANVEVEGANGQEVTVELEVAGIKADKTYVALHQKDDGEWEVLDVVVLADGKIALTSSNWSPIVIVAVDVADEDDDDDDKKDEAAAVVSPKTGEVMPIVSVMAVICLAGVAVCAKKARD